MPKPPPTPPSSDIGGVHRDRHKVRAKRNRPDGNAQQDDLAKLPASNKARPRADGEIAPKGNAQ